MNRVVLGAIHQQHEIGERLHRAFDVGFHLAFEVAVVAADHGTRVARGAVERTFVWIVLPVLRRQLLRHVTVAAIGLDGARFD